MNALRHPLRHALNIVVRAHAAVLVLALALGLAACSSPQAPPPQYYELRLDVPAAAAAPALPASVPADGAADVWQLMAPVKLPEYLDRDVLWLPVGTAGLQPLPGHRWAEPLTDAVPRILLHDLALLRGPGQVWSGALPSNLAVSHQLRVQILELSVAGDRRSVQLAARCSLSSAAGGAGAAPRIVDIRLSAASQGGEPDALVAAHRLALWKLAQEMVRVLRP